MTIIHSVSAAAYADIYAATAVSRRPRQAAAAARAPAGDSVDISPAAREAAKNDSHTGIPLPHAAFWTNKDFPADILAEAKARLSERRPAPGIGDGYLPSTVSNLPMLPENQALLERFRQEMREIGHNNSDPDKSLRFNQLLNLSMRVQIDGWKAPMTEADVQREFDISRAMAMLDAGNPRPAPAEPREALPDPMAGWRQRWQEEGLPMPPVSAGEPGSSLWESLAGEAGVGKEEFLAKARALSANLKGEALTRAIEGFISGRYVALQEEKRA